MKKGVTLDVYRNIKKKFGDHASWAIWSEPQSGNWSSKEDVGDLSVFDDTQILKELNPNIVFLSICRSREYEVTINPPAWLNFHDGRSIGQDYKLRYALHGTPFWGSYITNLVVTEICEHGSHSTFDDACYQSLVNELRELPAREPLIIVALGTAVVKTFETGPMRPLSKVFFSTLFINSYLQDLPCNFLQIGRAFAIPASCADVSD